MISYQLFICSLFIFIYLKSVSSLVQFEINPDCDLPECSSPGHSALYYGSTDIADDSIHVFYSSFDELTISVFQTKTGHRPIIDYTALFNGTYKNAIQFGDIAPINSMSIIIRRLLIFSDNDDKATLKNDDPTIQSVWLNRLKTNFTERNQTFAQPNFQLLLENISGSLNLDIKYPGELTRDTNYPKLRSTPKSFYINVGLQAANISDTKTRFGLEYYLIQYGKEGYEFVSTRFIDDQYTPGIFNVCQIKSRSISYVSSLLWKPIVYQSAEHEVDKYTIMKIYNLQSNLSLDPIHDQGIFRSFYAVAYVTGFNISLGFPNDGFFIKTNYSSFQLTAGLDMLEIDSVQQFILLALVICIALPTLVAVIACVFICKRRCSQRRAEGYDAINDYDD